MASVQKIQPRKQSLQTQDSESLAQKIWGLDWKLHFPRTLTANIVVDRIAAVEAWPLVHQLFPEVYQRDATESRFKDDGAADAKQKYYEELGDFFVFQDLAESDRVMGLAVGSLLDWSSYNFRNIAVHPDYQNLGLYPMFFELLASIMKDHGVRRIEGDVAPSNQHHLHVLNKMGCVVSSLGYSERWGVLLHMTRYLQDEDREQCARLFSMTASSDIAAMQRPAGKK
ncbi:GNAT family N-acetyltransferase [Oligoflexus tunisiensis]|uniref:GNAT family N-acetyltransferase n=1 Tax=Oligoflexus tunisiensis TaxID=708132 RepID=UPI001C40513A|nr:GNAT family N-acetyltransferase [Oligoflexus tunisiensis]